MPQDRPSDRLLIRYLHGELPAGEVRQLRAELARDPALQARLSELHRLWQGLQAPPATPAPFGFVPKLQRLADERRAVGGASLLGFAAAPPWARALAGAALVAGVALGIGLGRLPQPAEPGRAVVATQAIQPQAAARSPLARPPVSAPRTPATVPPGPAQPSAAPAAPLVPYAGETVDSTPIAGGDTLAEQYWEALAGGEGDGSDGEPGESPTP